MGLRIEIARFFDPECAALAADFLGLHRISATTLDCSGYKSPTYTKVLVKRDRAAKAYTLLKQAYDGAFAEGYPGGSDEQSHAAIKFTRSLHGSGYKGSNPAWLDLLPILLIAAALLFYPVVLQRIRYLGGGDPG
jgi:hypothetical protein